MNKYRPLRIKGLLSFLIDKRALLFFLLLLLILIIFFIISTGSGEMKIPAVDVVKALFGYGPDMNILVVNEFRLPRIITAVLVGMSLAVAGSILQGIIRNPLASPDIIGITGGAAVAVVGFLAIFSDANHSLTVSIKWLPLAAFLGATCIALLVYFLSWKNGVSPIRLVLIGIGIAALTQAITTTLMIIGPIYRASQATMWITGTVYGASWSNVKILAPWALVLLVISFVLARKLNVQELGDDLAKGVGSSVQKERFILLLISTALTGGAVAFAGGVGFVGLMAPHIARKIVGSAFGALLPISALVGGLLVLVADLIGRTMFSPLEVPAGVFTAAIGAPFFIYLLYKNRNL